MIGLSKTLIVAVTASLLSGGALVALTNGAGPGGGSDYGLDTDGDGAYDWLVVRMDLRVDETNYYNIWATLGTDTPVGGGCFGSGPVPLGPPIETRCPDGARCLGNGDPEPELIYPISSASVREFLESGDHEVALAFRGTDIGLAGADGPYTVQAQVYADGGWPEPYARGAPEPWPGPQGWSWTYTTQAYDAGSFEQPRFAIEFAGTHADEGLDLDGDGLFDYLVLRADAGVNLAGTYSFDGSLVLPYDGGEYRGYWVTSTYGTVDLGEGPQAIEFRFNGGDLWASGHSGAFDFQVNVYYGGYFGGWANGTIREGEPYPPQMGGDFDVYGDNLCGRTAEYRHDGWEERVEPADFTGVFADRGEDYDGDGLFDVLAVDAEVEVREANWFDFSGSLMSEDGSLWIAADYQQAYLDVGVQTLTLRFVGGAIRASGVDGPYRVDMNLVVGMRDPTASYVTGAYSAADFDEDDQTRPRMHWIANLTADGSSIDVFVVRGDDLLTYVIEDVLTVHAIAADGTVAFEAADKVYLPGGGSTQSFTFAWNPDPGTYVIRAALGDPAMPTDVVEIVVTL